MRRIELSSHMIFRYFPILEANHWGLVASLLTRAEAISEVVVGALEQILRRVMNKTKT